jgi:cytoskeleton-associated protein 5
MNSAVSTTNDDSTAVLIKEARESLSLSQRLSHSNWRVRSDALDSINAVLLPFQDVDHEHQYEDSTVTYDDVLGCRGVSVEVGKAIAKAVGDVNANVMDMALETYRMYLRCLGYIIINGGCVDGSMVEQMAEISLSAKGIGGACLKAQKRSTVSKAVEVCMELIELGVWEVVVRNVVDIGFVNKVPKGVVGATEVVLEAVRSFDAGAFDQEGFAKAVVGGIVKTKVYSHANNGVRSNVKDILVGLMVKKNKRIDGIVRALLFEQLPDVMKKDIVSNVEQYGSDGTAAVTVTRYSKVQRAEMALREGDEDGGGEDLAHDADVEMMDVDEVEEGPSEDVDPYEFAEPKDVMTSLHKTKVKIVGGDGESQEDVLFWDCFESKKWNVRKSAVEMLCDVLTRAVRLDPSCQQEYSSVVRELKKILAKDANIHCAAGAAMAGEALAKGLRRDFSGLAKQMCPDILQRFKEKNPVMCQAADSCLQTFGTYCYSLKDVSDDIAHALKHKNPKVRYDTLRYVSFLVDKETKQSVSQCKDTLAAAVQLAPDADGKIREEAQKVIVEYGRKMGGFHAVKPYLNGLDASRRDIIEKALLESGSRPKETSTKRLEVKKPAPSKPVQKKVAESVGRSKSAAVTKKPAAASLQAKTPSTASKPSMSDSMNSIKNTVSEEDAEEFLIQNFGAELVENLKSPLWQGRLAAMTDILDRAREVPSMGMLLLSLAKVPGWDDKNFQVLNKILEVCTVVAEDSNEFGAVHASCVVEGAVEKIHELKHRSQATKSLTASCERVGPRLVVSLVHQKAAWHKNPKVLAESLFWIGNTIDQFGYAEIDNKGSISAWMKDDLGSSNAAVRAQALNLLGICHSQVGQGPFQSLIDSLKPALVTSLQESFAKKPLDSSYEPSLLVKANVPDVDVNDFAADDIVNAMSAATVLEEEAPAVDLNFTRVDVSGSLNDALVAKMMSKNWKERNAAVESVEEILSSAKHITPDLSTDFLSALRARFGDANRNLAARSISLVGQLALAVGAPFDKIAHGVLLSPAILNLSDTKKQVRDAVVVMLDAWASTCPKERMFPALADAVSNPKGHPEGKVVALKWMVDNYVADSAKCKEVGHKASKTAAADKVAAVRDMGAQLSSLCSGSTASVASRPASAKKTPMPKKPVVSKTPVRSVPRDKSSKTSIEQTPAKSVKRNIAKNDVEYDEPLISMGHGKGTRSKQFRPKPGGFEPPSAADVAKLQEMLAPVLSTAIRSQMFSNQFQDHVMALESLIDAASQLMSEILTSLDLILQWTVYILCEANTQSSIRALDLLRVILENVCDDGYRLNDMEAAILLPAVIEKSGQNQDYLRSAYRTIIVLAASTVNPAKVIDYIIVGLGSKNSRTRVECCLALSEIVRQHGGRFAASAKNKPVLALSQVRIHGEDSLNFLFIDTLNVVSHAVCLR